MFVRYFKGKIKESFRTSAEHNISNIILDFMKGTKTERKILQNLRIYISFTEIDLVAGNLEKREISDILLSWQQSFV